MDIRVVDYLAGEIGVRFAGTPSEVQGARYLLEQFQAMGLSATLDWFRFLGWELGAEPVLQLTSPIREHIPCFALVYSPSTPRTGLELPLRKMGKTELLKGIDCNKYALVDPQTGMHCAHVITRLDGPGCAMTLLDPVRAVPTVLVGGEEAQALERWAEEYHDLRARVNVKTALKQDARSCNVLATLPGADTEKTILVIAHHDTQYNSPGAVDNASGVQGALMLARRLAQQRLAKTVQFAIFGAEEYMFLGSKHYAQRLQETGALRNIEAVVNLDMIACNSPTWINLTQDHIEFKVRVARVFERYGVFQRFGDVHWQVPPWPTSDHAPFCEAGVPTLFISYRGQCYPYLHLPGDTIDKVDVDLLGLSVDCLHAIVEDLVKAE